MSNLLITVKEKQKSCEDLTKPK